jgi:RNA polymerase sigma factor (sigma-70 family)
MNTPIKDVRLIARLKNNQLLARREKLGLTVGVIAEEIGLSYPVYSKFENLHTPPISRRTGKWLPSAIKIAEYHKVAPEELWPDWVQCLENVLVERELDWEDAKKLMSGEHINRLSLGEHTYALAADPSDLAEYHELKQALDKVLRGALTPRERSFLFRYYGIGRQRETYGDIGRAENVSRERVRQIVTKALRKVRSEPECRELRIHFSGVAVAEDLQRAYAEEMRQFQMLRQKEKLLDQTTKLYWQKLGGNPAWEKTFQTPAECWEVCVAEVTDEAELAQYLRAQYRAGCLGRRYS